MADQSDIFEVRLKLSDPFGFIAFVEVDDADSLPASPASQTCYLQSDVGEYKSTDLTTNATSDDYDTEDLFISDDYLGTLIDDYGTYSATCKALKIAVARLGKEMLVKKNSAGADSTEYQELSAMVAYYQDLLELCSDDKKSANKNDSGRWHATKSQEIAGGNL